MTELFNQTLLDCQTYRDLVLCMFDEYSIAPSENKVTNRLAALSKIPLEHCGTAAFELIGASKWIPTAAEWRDVAVRHWEDAKRRERMRGPQLQSRPMTREQREAEYVKWNREMPELLKQRAANGCKFSQTLLGNFEKFGTFGRVARRANI